MKIPELLSALSIQYNAIIRDAASSLGLSSSQALHLISIPYDGISMSGLSNKIGLDTSTLTRNIYRLEKLKLVIRKRNQYDRRVLIIYLTEAGQLIVDKIDQILSEINNNLIKSIDIKTHELTLDILEKLTWEIECLRNQH